MIGNIIDDKAVQDKVGYECYDIVAANILAPVLVELTPVIVNQLKPGGIYITSGIIDDKEETVKEAVAKAGLELIDVTYQGEWVCVTARKKELKEISKRRMECSIFLRIGPGFREIRSGWKDPMSII